MMGIAQLANLAASGAVALFAIAFAVTYQLRYPGWRLSETGWHMMGMSTAIGLLGLYTILVTIWPTGCIADTLRWGRTLVLVLIALLLLQRISMVLRPRK